MIYSIRLKSRFVRLTFAMAISFAITFSLSCDAQRGNPGPSSPDTIRVVVIKYFPVAEGLIDINITGDWGESLAYTRHKVDSVSATLAGSLSEGTRYHAYENPSAPSALYYDIVAGFEVMEPLPTLRTENGDVPMTDYSAIMERFGAEDWVVDEGVQEFWIWAYHGGVVGLWESNMSGPYADISNSDRDQSDLPIFPNTYTVYHYNYQRGTAEAMENHMHQLEAVLNHFDGRDDASFSEWEDLLFWGKFVGSDSTHRLLSPVRAGWSHYPPNATSDYEWANPDPVLSDIRDWNPDGLGRQEAIACGVWKCDHLNWFIFWTQNIPGANHSLEYKGRPLRNWWDFLAKVDTAFEERWRLWY